MQKRSHVWPYVRCLLAEVRNVLFPRGCAGCGAPDNVVCPACAAQLAVCIRREFPQALAGDGSAWACAVYSGCVRRAILRWKDHGDREAGRVLTSACAAVVSRVAQQEGWTRVLHGRRIAVIPAPSSRASVRRRGRLQTFELAETVAQALQGQGIAATPVCGLVMRGTRKTVQNSARRSRQNRGHGISAVRRRVRGYTAAVVVDDICTTGSTLLSCARALREVSLPVLTLAAIASVPDSAEATSVPDPAKALMTLILRHPMPSPPLPIPP